MAKRVQEFKKPTGLVLNKALARRYQNSNISRPNQVLKPNGPQLRKAVRRPPTSNAPKRNVIDLTRDSTTSASPSPDKEVSDTTSPVHDMPPTPAPRRYIRKGETPSQEPSSQLQAKANPLVARARDTLSPDTAIEFLEGLLNNDDLAEEVAESLRDSGCCIRTEFGINYGHRGQPLHNLGPLMFRRALDKVRTERRIRVLPSAMNSHPTSPDSPGPLAGPSKVSKSTMSSTVRFTSRLHIIPSASSAHQSPSSYNDMTRNPTALAENVRIFETLHPILRVAMVDEVHEVEVPTVPSVMTIRNPQALQGIILSHIFQFPSLEPFRRVKSEWMKHRGGPIPTKEDVERALEFLDGIGAPRSLLQVYSTMHEIDVATWHR